MSDSVRQLIVERLEVRQISMMNASVKMGRNASYLQQFVRRGVPEELRERDRAKLAELLGVTESELRGASELVPPRPYAKSMNAKVNAKDRELLLDADHLDRKADKHEAKAKALRQRARRIRESIIPN